MAEALMSIPECDRRLDLCRQAYHDAIDVGDLSAADARYVELDQLLDLRQRLPQQRTSVLDRLRAAD